VFENNTIFSSNERKEELVNGYIFHSGPANLVINNMNMNAYSEVSENIAMINLKNSKLCQPDDENNQYINITNSSVTLPSNPNGDKSLEIFVIFTNEFTRNIVMHYSDNLHENMLNISQYVLQ
jgi:hypothetical protein